MPRRRLLNAAEREMILAFPTTDDDLIRYYSFTESDLSTIRQRRGSHNRLGFAVQLCCLRYPGSSLPTDAEPPASLLALVAMQLGVDVSIWQQYAQRAETRREHLIELQAWLNLSTFSQFDYRCMVDRLSELAQQTDRGIVLAVAMVKMLRQQHIIIPGVDVIDRLCAEALTLGTRLVYEALTEPLAEHHCRALDSLLSIRDDSKVSSLAWLRQSPGPPNAKHILAHISRLEVIRDISLPDGLQHAAHQNRLLKLAREGGQMTAQHLRDLEPIRRYATLVAITLDTQATLIDETIDLHGRVLSALFSRAKRRHVERFHKDGRAINDKVRLYSRIGRALLQAKQTGTDPFAAIEADQCRCRPIRHCDL